MILLDVAPSNDEMLGFFIVFGLLLFIFLVAKLFGPHEGAAPILSERDDGGGSFLGKLFLGCVIIGIILWVVANSGAAPH